jgi:hypothetical protein
MSMSLNWILFRDKIYLLKLSITMAEIESRHYSGASIYQIS